MSRITSTVADPAPGDSSPAVVQRSQDDSALPRFLLRRSEAARACGMSPASWDRLVSAGKTPAPIRLGKRLVWRVAELAAWADAGCPPRAEWEALQKQKRVATK